MHRNQCYRFGSSKFELDGDHIDLRVGSYSSRYVSNGICNRCKRSKGNHQLSNNHCYIRPLGKKSSEHRCSYGAYEAHTNTNHEFCSNGSHVHTSLCMERDDKVCNELAYIHLDGGSSEFRNEFLLDDLLQQSCVLVDCSDFLELSEELGVV